MKKYPTKIDPDTGCEVLTLHGFMMSEADHHGRSVDEEYDLLAKDMDEIYKEEKARLEDPAEVKAAINSEVKFLRKSSWESMRYDHKKGRKIERDDCDFLFAFLPYVEGVVEVLEVDPGNPMGRHTEQTVVAVATRNGGVKDIVTFRYSHDAGSYLEPPDTEIWVEWHGLPHTRMDERIGDPCPCQDCEYLRTGRYPKATDV